jgi:peptidase E
MIIIMKRRMTLVNLDAHYDILGFSDFLIPEIKWRFKNASVSEVLFVPYAYDGSLYNTYIQDVKKLFALAKVTVKIITDGDPASLIKSAAGLVIGGGNLEKLLEGIVTHLPLLKERLTSAVPYLGWNEGGVAASPSYVVPAVIPVSPKCIGVTDFQLYTHFVDSPPNRLEIKNFLLNHKNDNPPIEKVYCMTDGPGGGGIRLEDDNEGLCYGPGSDPSSIIRFGLSGGNLVTV